MASRPHSTESASLLYSSPTQSATNSPVDSSDLISTTESTPSSLPRKPANRKKKTHICPHCGRICSRKSVLDNHIATHVAKGQWPCPDCPLRKFSSRHGLLDHFRKSHSHTERSRLEREADQRHQYAQQQKLAASNDIMQQQGYQESHTGGKRKPGEARRAPVMLKLRKSSLSGVRNSVAVDQNSVNPAPEYFAATPEPPQEDFGMRTNATASFSYDPPITVAQRWEGYERLLAGSWDDPLFPSFDEYNHLRPRFHSTES